MLVVEGLEFTEYVDYSTHCFRKAHQRDVTRSEQK